MKTLRQLGPYPPPYGGVAIHLVRLCELLENAGVVVERVSTVATNDRTVKSFSISVLFSRTRTHYHTDEGNYKSLILMSLWWRLTRTPYALTFHSFRNKPAFNFSVVRFFLKGAIGSAKGVITVSTSTESSIKSILGLSPDYGTSKGVRVIDSALPISNAEKKAPLWQSIPEQWLNAKHRAVVNAGRIVRYNEKDLYGIDVAIRAFNSIANLKNENTDVHLLVVTGTVVDPSLLADYYSLKSHNHLVHIVAAEESPLVPVHAHATMVLRCTRTEGGPSLTLTEALELGKFAVGSDAVVRPNGTLTYATESPADLAELILKLCAQEHDHNVRGATTNHVSSNGSTEDKTDRANSQYSASGELQHHAETELLNFYREIDFI
ncbi:MAG: glycosyltransferase family 4 protein [Ignavibacteria bacterium]|nr:glycosyltransferase family 4 protein [Ignavibacteria bacterium]